MNAYLSRGADFFAAGTNYLRRHRRASLIGAGTFLLLVYLFIFSAPRTFSDHIISIPRGTAAPEASRILADAHIVRYPSLVRLSLRILGKSDAIQAGAYRFTTPQNVFWVTYRLVTGDFGLPSVRLTFPEGITVREIAEQVASAFPLVTEAEVLKLADPYEGYLFPDTYLLPPSTDAASLVSIMRTNFNTKLSPLLPDVSASGHSLADIIVMASLVEKEARSPENKAIIAGILYNRLAKGMLLQVDAVFGYIKGRDTYSPSYADLKIDSPYNTYTHKGLPPGPIDNPGLESIQAALHPTKTNYYFYLTGKDGLMHYATTYAQHQVNLRKYLQ